MIVAVKYLGCVGEGATSPQLFRGDDGKIYVVKLQNNRLGLKVLVNEILAARVGDILGLCFPNSDIIELNEDTLQKSSRLLADGVPSGKHFGCQFLSRSKYLERHNMQEANNIAEMAGVILFDQIFHNLDRTWNRRNILIRREDDGYKIYAIDNSHLFIRGLWTIEMLDNLVNRIKINYYRSYDILLTKYLTFHDFLPYIEKVKKINNKQIEKIISDIPYEWLPDESERQALARYVRLRRDMVDKIMDKICEFIPVKDEILKGK